MENVTNFCMKTTSQRENATSSYGRFDYFFAPLLEVYKAAQLILNPGEIVFFLNQESLIEKIAF